MEDINKKNKKYRPIHSRPRSGGVYDTAVVLRHPGRVVAGPNSPIVVLEVRKEQKKKKTLLKHINRPR
jgi:hypothetical protein